MIRYDDDDVDDIRRVKTKKHSVCKKIKNNQKRIHKLN